MRNFFRKTNPSGKDTGIKDPKPEETYTTRKDVDVNTQFIRNVSHRMNIDPVIMAPYDIDNLGGNNVPKFVENLFKIGNEYNRKLRDIVEYSNVMNGNFVSVDGPLLVRNLLSNAIENSKNRIRDLFETSPIVNIEIMQGVPVSELIGDGPAVTKILEELIFNGLRHSFYNEVSVSVWADKYENTKIYFSVENIGIVIPPGEVESIFEPFRSISTSEGVVANKGVGLGLAKCKKMAGIIKGSLDAESGETTMFTLTVLFKHSKVLVLNKTNLDVNYSRERRSLTDYANSDGGSYEIGLDTNEEKSLSVLVVDDSPLVLKMFDKMLTKIGVEAEVCTEPMVALEKIQTKKYDSIFLDVIMPVMNGITCAHEIRRGDTVNNNTPIIVVTADMTTETRQLTSYISNSILIEKPARLSVVTRSLVSVIADTSKTDYLREHCM